MPHCSMEDWAGTDRSGTQETRAREKTNLKFKLLTEFVLTSKGWENGFAFSNRRVEKKRLACLFQRWFRFFVRLFAR